MKQYKLINNTTKEETICNLVTIDGFDYYVSDTKQPLVDGELYHCNNKGKGIYVGNGIPKQVLTISKYSKNRNLCKDCKLVIATNNHNIDISKVIDIDIINTLAKNATEAKKFANGLHEKVVAEIYFKKGFNKAKETSQFTEKDMIDYNEWINNNQFTFDGSEWVSAEIYYSGCSYTSKQLLELFKEQKIQTVYY